MKALEKYSAVVDEVHITELDVGCSRTDENVWYYQAKFYYDFFARLIEEVKSGAKLTSVTVWGLTDDASWRADFNPLLFYGDLKKKPAFDAIVMAAKGEEFAMAMEKEGDDSAPSGETDDMSKAVEEAEDEEDVAAAGNVENLSKIKGTSVVLIAGVALAAGAVGFGWWRSRKKRIL